MTLLPTPWTEINTTPTPWTADQDFEDSIYTWDSSEVDWDDDEVYWDGYITTDRNPEKILPTQWDNISKVNTIWT